MFNLRYLYKATVTLAWTLFLVETTCFANPQTISGTIPKVVTSLQSIGHLDATNRLNLSIGLPLRNAAGLSRLLEQIYDPYSPNYHHYLTSEQFTEQFGPTEQDYEAVKTFAKAHGMAVSGTHPNRMIVDVNGAVTDVERALHIKMLVYRHPTEGRLFYAPDKDPSLDLAVPVLQIGGLETYSKPHPNMVAKPLTNRPAALPNAGSGLDGTYMGGDFRAAYVPDTTMTGTGQVIGLLEYDGYTTSDITYYESQAGLPNVPLTNVLLDGFSGAPTGDGGEVEVSLDIEMAVSMAPGASGVMVYEAGPEGNWHDILNRMASDNLAKQLSCSWYSLSGPDPVAEQIFQEMAAQGQSFFAASGDSDAYFDGMPFPDDSPSITLVGGTTLTTTGPQGAWVSETVWNWGNGQGSSGGISTYYAIPPYQTNISMAANQGSTTMRNVPDVALTADNVYVRADGINYDVGGTSCAAPLWAAFIALVNQEASLAGRPTVGFINPALDTIGSSVNYSNSLHDISTGNNTSPNSPNKFFAVPGYDLCTGWGVPAGQNLIKALAVPDPLGIEPDAGFTAVGGSGGPFTVNSENFVLTNASTNLLNWSMVNTSLWLAVSPPSGTLAPGAFDNTPQVSLNAGAYSLPIGNYSAVVVFSNLTAGSSQNRQFTLQIVPSVPPAIVTPPASQSIAVNSNVIFSVAASGTPPLNYQWQFDTTNITGATNTTLVLTNVNFNEAGSYTVVVTNTHGSTNATAVLMVGNPPAITSQPQSVEVIQGSNATFSVTASGSGTLNYQWYFYGVPLPQATNAELTVTNVQATNSGNYSVVVNSPFGSIVSSNALLGVEIFPIIVVQPASQNIAVGSNVTFSVTATTTASSLPPVVSGSLQLWLRADAGVITNGTGSVSQWQDQSGNNNNASQSNPNLQPILVSAAGLGGLPVVRFNGIQDNINGSYLFGPGQVNIPNAMTMFSMYNAFNATNQYEVSWYIGIPGETGDVRGEQITDGDLHFTFWSVDYDAPYIVPTNTYRIRIDRLDTNLDTLDMFDVSENGSTNFTFSTSGAAPPGAGYYVGGLNSSVPYVGSSRNFYGDIAEMLCYQGYLSESDRIAVASYLEQKYYGNIGSVGVSYQWQFNGTNIAGATNAFLTLTNVQFTNDGSYSVIVSNDIGVTVSSNAVLTAGYPPSIGSQPQNQTVVQGSNASFSVTASGSGTLSYQWYFDGAAALAQATNSTLTLTNVQVSNGGSYSVVVSSPFGTIISSNAILIVESLPIITIQPQSQAALVGNNVTLTVGVDNATLPSVSSGTLALWLRADAGVVTNASGAVTQWNDQSGNANNAVQSNTNQQPMLVAAAGLGGMPAVRFNGIQDNVHGDYMYGTGNVGLSNALTAFTIYNAFSAVNQQNVLWNVGVPGPAGQSRGINISSDMEDFTFWSHDFRPSYDIPTNTYRIWTARLSTNLQELDLFDNSATNATNFTLAASGAATPAAGYYVGGLNAPAPGVGSSLCFNGDIVEWLCYQGYLSETDRQAVLGYLEQKYYFGGVTNGLAYQWQFDGTNIANATNAFLTLTNVQFSNDGSYSVVVSNDVGATVSSNAVLAVGYAPSIASQPQNLTVVQGSNALFSVTSGGTGPFNYQWFFDGTNIAGATNSALSLTDVQLTNDGNYSVTVSSLFGSIASSNAVLTVEPLPVITAGPQSQVAVVGGNVLLSVIVSNAAGSGTLPTVNSGTLQLWLKADTGVVTNASGAVTQWNDQSGNTNNASQSNTNLQPALVAATGLGGMPAVRFNGIQDNVHGDYMYGTGNVGLSNALTGFAVYNAFSAVNQQNVIWNVGVPGQAGQSRGINISSDMMDFTFWSYDYRPSYKIPTNTYRIWTARLSTNLQELDLFDNSATNATNFTFSTSGAATPAAGYYLGGLNPSLSGVGSSLCFNGDIVEWLCYKGYLSESDRMAVTGYLEQKYFGIVVNYQWQFDGTNIVGATNSSLSLTDVQVTNSGSYSVVVSNSIGSVTSSNAVLQVGNPPSIAGQPQNQTVAQGNDAAFSVTPGGTGPFSFQWYFDGTAVAQATNSIFFLSDVQLINSGTYYALVSSPFGSISSSNALLTVDTLPVIAVQPQSQTLIVGSNLTLSVVANVTALPTVSSGTLALWLRSDAGVVTNASGAVTQWNDQSGNANNAVQSNTNQQPMLVAAAGLGGMPAVRFNGIQDNVHGDYMYGTGNVGLSNALTGFAVYNAFSAVNQQNVIWNVGIPGRAGQSRGINISSDMEDFTFWSYDFRPSYDIPTNTYRIWTARLSTNLQELDLFDNSATNATNFTFLTSGAETPGAGYYLGGLNPSLSGVGSSLCFNGDIVEWLCYQGYLSETDRQAVLGYLEQKYYFGGVTNGLTYQWQFDGTNIANATNTTLTLTNVQLTNGGSYSVIVSNGVAFTVSSNAVLTLNEAPVILSQPGNLTVTTPNSASFGVNAFALPAPTYQWQYNGTNLPDGTSASFIIPAAVPADGGSYTVIVSNYLGTAVSPNTVLLVNYYIETHQGQAQRLATTNLTVPSSIRPGDVVLISGVDAASVQGGQVQLNQGSIIYTPPTGFTGEDMFYYTLSPFSGPPIRGLVSVLVDASLALGGTVNNGQATIQFIGVPGTTYSIQTSTDLINWTVIGSTIAGPNGYFGFLDPNAGQYGQRYYRTVILPP